MYFDYCGDKIWYEEVGDGEKTIVFLHGWGCDHRVFYWLKTLFFQKFRCVFVDFLGFGKSDQPKVPQTIEMQSGSITALCNFLEIKNFSIIAHSYGGRVAFSLLSEENSRVKSAFLFAPAGVPQKGAKKKLKTTLFKIRKRITRKENLSKLQKYYSEDYINASEVGRKMLLSAVNFDQTPQLCKIKQKVAILRGKADTAVTKKMIATMKKNLKNATIITTGGGHFAFLNHTKEVSLLLYDFFWEEE